MSRNQHKVIEPNVITQSRRLNLVSTRKECVKWKQERNKSKKQGNAYYYTAQIQQNQQPISMRTQKAR